VLGGGGDEAGGALHRNSGARKKARAARLVSTAS